MKRILLLVIFLLANPCWGDCVLHYTMNDNAESATVVDSAGTSNGTAQQNTNILHTTGKINGALTFNGSSDYIDTGDTYESTFQDSFSVSFWAQSDDGQSSIDDYGLFFNKGIVLGEAFIFNWTKHGRIYVSYGTGLGAADNVYSDIVFNDGVEEWHHIVAVCYQDGLYLTTKIYLDSVLIITQTSESTITMADYTTSNNCEIGRSILGYNSMDGLIDNVMIFNEALSTDKVERLYNNGNGTEMPCFLEGDLNQDCYVDLNDFAALALHWQESDCGVCGGADLDGDADVDFNDLKKLADNWLEEQLWPVE